jgi:hypothetical protein
MILDDRVSQRRGFRRQRRVQINLVKGHSRLRKGGFQRALIAQTVNSAGSLNDQLM